MTESTCNLKEEFNSTLIKMLEIFEENPNEGGYLEFANYTMEAKTKIEKLIDDLINSKYYKKQKELSKRDWSPLTEAQKAENPDYKMCVPCGKHIHKNYLNRHLSTDRHRQSVFCRVALSRAEREAVDKYKIDDDVISNYIVLQEEFLKLYGYKENWQTEFDDELEQANTVITMSPLEMAIRSHLEGGDYSPFRIFARRHNNWHSSPWSVPDRRPYYHELLMYFYHHQYDNEYYRNADLIREPNPDTGEMEDNVVFYDDDVNLVVI